LCKVAEKAYARQLVLFLKPPRRPGVPALSSTIAAAVAPASAPPCHCDEHVSKDVHHIGRVLLVVKSTRETELDAHPDVNTQRDGEVIDGDRPTMVDVYIMG
jgi:hypothetical protein